MSNQTDPTTEDMRRVWLVGHCGFDSHGLAAAVERALPDAAVQRVNDEAALEQAGPMDLLLVNRALDGSFDATDGVELIERLHERPEPPAALLISNYPDAQERAEAAGAAPGFGKRAMGGGESIQRLRDAAPWT